ncbi:alpha/beta fold hydrolase [Herbiconiux sp. UC225_62]|jgi:pimeloyl-ACP methyl ester carboxylesterase|uniref:alpha/beta fold hydrolase n=1 Tax=Herbiconiux sp. UC225_62 TaxID=3350168 RepID=UPI0036D22979
MTEFLADKAETLFVDAPSARFAYRRLGRPNGVPLVMAMRLRGTIDHWDPAFLDALSATREVIIFDNRGINLSTGTPASSITEMAEGLIEFTTALSLEKFDLFGWSMGGMVVATAALARPELVGHLVFSGSTPGIIEGQPLAQPKVWQVAGRGANTEEDFLFLFYPETEAGIRHGRSQLDRLRTRLDVSEAVVSAEASAASIEAIRAFGAGVFERLPELTIPVLIGVGLHDVMAPPYSSIQAVSQLSRGKLVVYSDAGHGFLFQYHADYAAEVTSFLSW